MEGHRSCDMPTECLCIRINFLVQSVSLTHSVWTHKDDYIRVYTCRSQLSMS